ncbi:MAG: 30S ribosomal protein S9 [Lentisphaerota bacterium]
MAKVEITKATGRRKCASAQVRIKPGTGKCTINERAMDDYFQSEIARGFAQQPLVVTEMKGKLDISATIKGGGIIGQAGALRHAIARALCTYDEKFKAALKAAGLLTRDPRVKERKKSGQPGARKRFQFSKR